MIAQWVKTKHQVMNRILKSSRTEGGDAIDILVANKVAWPQDHILGGPTKQRIAYDQLSLTQIVQGFARNMLDEKDRKCSHIWLI